MDLTYPSRDEARRYRHELHEAVAAARKGERAPKQAVAWPTGLDRILLRGLPLPTHTRHALMRSGLTEGRDGLTVAEMLLTPEVGDTAVRNLLVGIDDFLVEYIEAFQTKPGPTEVAAMRFERAVRGLTPTQWAAYEQRRLTDPPVEYHALAVRLDVSSGRIRARQIAAQEQLEVALGPELRIIADELKARLGATSDEWEVNERVDAWLDEVLPSDAGGVPGRTRRVFRHELIRALSSGPTTNRR